MPLGTTSEDIFRFSVVRNPQTVPPERLRDTVVRIAPDDAGEQYKYLKQLAALRVKNPTRSAFVAQAAKLVATPEFAGELTSLKTPLWRFVERLQALSKPSLSDLQAALAEVFGVEAAALVKQAEFTRDRILVADGLVLASVVSPPAPGLRSRLMQARRAIAFIERVGAPGDVELVGAERLLSATLLLPNSVFPIPDNNKGRRDENTKEHDRKKAALEKEAARAQGLLNELAQNTAAVEELSGHLSKHLFDKMQLQTPAASGATVSTAAAAAAAPISLLPPEQVRKLSTETRKIVLEKLELAETAVDVPFAVGQLERANQRLGQELATQFGNAIVTASPFTLPTCGECKPVVLSDPKAENNFSPDTRGVVEVVGVQELLIVRQSLREYRVGEISHIENVLQGEKKSSTHRQLDRSEVTTVDESEKEHEVQTELQTTDKYELQTQASRVISEDRAVEAGVTVTASYGPVSVEAHGNYASSTSSQESRNSASTFARDVLNRSLERIRERLLKRVTRTQISEVEVTSFHEFNNTAPPAHNVAGIYRFVDKFYEAQIVNYGKRLMLEFMIPEPGAFCRYAAAKKPVLGPEVPRPERPGFCRNGVFHPLSPADLQPENYLCLVAKYNVKNVSAPSPRYVRASDALKFKLEAPQGEPVPFAEANDSFKIPEGYAPKGVSYTISGGNTHSGTTSNSSHDDILLAVVTIADRKVFSLYRNEIGQAAGQESWPALEQVIEWGNPLSATEQNFKSYVRGSLTGEFALPHSSPGVGDADVVKVSLTGHATLPLSVAIHYTVLCERLQSKFQQWQLDTFNAIMDAYATLKSDYDDAQQAQANVSETLLPSQNPLLNRQTEQRELKKFSISVLTGQQYESFNAMEEHYQTGIPQIDVRDAAEEGRFVRFFEQALEWRNMSYLFYPYFWGRKARWAETSTLKDADPLFEQFLQAGYARVWVPVRPGFEPVILNYIECGGEPWTEKDAPLAGLPDETSAPTVALIDEIKEQLGVDFQFRVGTVEVKKDQKLVKGTGTDFTAADVDREILLEFRQYRIASVDEAAQTLRLREPYARDDADALGFAIGVKFVGEPWLVQVPTRLVYLESGSDLVSE